MTRCVTRVLINAWVEQFTVGRYKEGHCWA